MLGEGKRSFQPSDEITVKGMLRTISQYELMNGTNMHGRRTIGTFYAALASL